MRTLFITRDFPPDSGGIARLYGELCHRFPPGGVEVCTVSAGGTGGSEPPRVPVHRMPFSSRRAKTFPNVVRWARWTGSRLSRGDIDLLQVGNIRPTGYVAAWTRARRGTPYVLYVHGSELLKERRKIRTRGPGRWSSRHILGGASAIIANSAATAALTRQLLDELGVPERGRVRVVNPGADPDRFRPSEGGGEKHDNGVVLLSISRLVPRKGIDTVIRALPPLLDAFPDLTYRVVGDGPDRRRLEALADEHGVRSAVRFEGHLPESGLAEAYREADVFVLPVREIADDDDVEGFGIVFSEAGAAGLPVIGSRSGGVPDAVRHGETGLLVEPDDVDDLREALRTLITDGELRRRLGRGGRAAVESYFNWDRAAAEVWSILEDVAGAGGSS